MGQISLLSLQWSIGHALRIRTIPRVRVPWMDATAQRKYARTRTQRRYFSTQLKNAVAQSGLVRVNGAVYIHYDNQLWQY